MKCWNGIRVDLWRRVEMTIKMKLWNYIGLRSVKIIVCAIHEIEYCAICNDKRTSDEEDDVYDNDVSWSDVFIYLHIRYIITNIRYGRMLLLLKSFSHNISNLHKLCSSEWIMHNIFWTSIIVESYVVVIVQAIISRSLTTREENSIENCPLAFDRKIYKKSNGKAKQNNCSTGIIEFHIFPSIFNVYFCHAPLS